MRPAPSLLGTPREWAIDLSVVTVIGVFLGVIGPYGSYYGGAAATRIAYWVANMWIGFIILALTVRLAARASGHLDMPAWFGLTLGVIVGAVPLALVLGLFSALVWPPNHGRPGPFFHQYVQCLIMSEPMAFAFYYLGEKRWRDIGVDQPSPSVAGSGGGFLDRLPARLGRDLLCLQMEDHYVRAHTPLGSELILMSLRDAIAELGDTEGLRVHRSWWVARRAVASSLMKDRNHYLRLTNGLEAPVSRASVAILRAAGWL